jgi:hypothetical protein
MTCLLCAHMSYFCFSIVADAALYSLQAATVQHPPQQLPRGMMLRNTIVLHCMARIPSASPSTRACIASLLVVPCIASANGLCMGNITMD